MVRQLFSALALTVLLPCAVAQSARFVPLGQLAGVTTTLAGAISADGTTVVGPQLNASVPSNEARAFRWTEAEGITYLGDGPNGFKSNFANAISGNGQVIIGSMGGGNPFTWTQAGGIEAIAPRLAQPTAITFDGSTIFGPNIPYNGQYNDVSWDGKVKVGHAYSEAFIEKDGIHTWLGDLPGFYFGSGAWAVSADGEVAVGFGATMVNEGGQSIGTTRPFRWTEAGGMEALGPWHQGVARDINAGKIVIVGEGSEQAGAGFHRKAFRWTPARGMESIEALLHAEGINVAAMGWDLSDAAAASANGHIITGWGKHFGVLESWLVELPVPGDFNGNGRGDGGDFLLWQRGFGSTHDADDYLDWKANFTLTPRTQALTAVPEPTALTVAAISLAASLSIGRRNWRATVGE